MAFCRLVVWVHSCSGHLFCQPWCLSLGLASITLWLQLCCQELITISCLCSCSVGARLAFLCDRASAQLGGMVTLEEMSPIYGAELAFSAEHSHMCRLHVRSVMESGRDQLSVWGTAGTGLGHVSCSLMNQHLWVKEYSMGNSPAARCLAPWWWEMWRVLECSWLWQRDPMAKVKAKQNSHWK